MSKHSTLRTPMTIRVIKRGGREEGKEMGSRYIYGGRGWWDLRRQREKGEIDGREGESSFFFFFKRVWESVVSKETLTNFPFFSYFSFYDPCRKKSPKNLIPSPPSPASLESFFLEIAFGASNFPQLPSNGLIEASPSKFPPPPQKKLGIEVWKKKTSCCPQIDQDRQ